MADIGRILCYGFFLLFCPFFAAIFAVVFVIVAVGLLAYEPTRVTMAWVSLAVLLPLAIGTIAVLRAGFCSREALSEHSARVAAEKTADKNLALQRSHLKSCFQDIAAALSVESGIKMVLCKRGLELAALCSHDKAWGLYPPYLAAMRVSGVNEHTISKNWERLKYKYVFPGIDSVNGEYWMRAADGVGVIRDKSPRYGLLRQAWAPLIEEPAAETAPTHKEIDVKAVAVQMARALKKIDAETVAVARVI
jgi:hypothetical protein